MERQHFVVLIDPVGRGRKTKHSNTGDESAACGERATEIVGRREKDGTCSQEVGRVSPVQHEREGRLRESGKAGWKEQGERVETHILPTPTTSTTSWLHSCLHGDELYVKSTWTLERKKDDRIHSFPRIFRVRDFPFFHVDARRARR
jgi:hypothetical protein